MQEHLIRSGEFAAARRLPKNNGTTRRLPGLDTPALFHNGANMQRVPFDQQKILP